MRTILSLLIFALATRCAAAAPETWMLAAEAGADSRGVFLADLLTLGGKTNHSALRLGNAPLIGRPVALQRAQIDQLLADSGQVVEPHVWAGAERVRITRRTRVLAEMEIKRALTVKLQEEHVRERGELELRFFQSWAPVVIPDEPLTINILDLPVAGVSPNFVARVEVRAGAELVGTHSLSLQARIWREIPVARSTIARGTLVSSADCGLERRDMLTLRDAVQNLPADPNLEFVDNINAGMPISPRSYRLRTVIKRGRLLDALLRDGTLTIGLRVEALEDGAPGQMVRVRNPQSKREFIGKVQDEQTVLVTL